MGQVGSNVRGNECSVGQGRAFSLSAHPRESGDPVMAELVPATSFGTAAITRIEHKDNEDHYSQV